MLSHHGSGIGISNNEHKVNISVCPAVTQRQRDAYMSGDHLPALPALLDISQIQLHLHRAEILWCEGLQAGKLLVQDIVEAEL